MNGSAIFSGMVKHKSIIAVAAVMFYLLPNLLHDVHRIYGHTYSDHTFEADAEKNVHQYSEKCLVCVYAFYSSDEIPAVFFTVSPVSCNFIFFDNTSCQTSIKVFDFSRLRAPPVS